jgi:hypothetical protein
MQRENRSSAAIGEMRQWRSVAASKKAGRMVAIIGAKLAALMAAGVAAIERSLANGSGERQAAKMKAARKNKAKMKAASAYWQRKYRNGETYQRRNNGVSENGMAKWHLENGVSKCQ